MAWSQPIQALYTVPVNVGERWLVALNSIQFEFPSNVTEPNPESVDIICSLVQGARIGSAYKQLLYRIPLAILPSAASPTLVNFVPADPIPLWQPADVDLASVEQVKVELRWAQKGDILPNTTVTVGHGTIVNLSFQRVQ
jgi:hypothetical protein